IPLCRQGLCEADTTAARSRPWRRTRIDAAGVGRTPASQASPPPSAIPAASAASSIGPDSRVSRTSRTWGREVGLSSAAARPSDSASSAVSSVPAIPRTPSVPKSLRSAKRRLAAPSALGELRSLAGLLEPRLAPLLGPSIAGQQTAPLQLAAQIWVDLGERTRDPMADGAGLAGDPASVYPHANVHSALVAGAEQGLPHESLVLMAREVVLERTPVDLEAAVAGPQDHAGDRRLALTGGLDPRFGG